jgi:very-short-patch-repair endonuclease
MDFLFLLGGRRRIVIEVDGRQHYADGAQASPQRYAEMVAEDRRLRLDGYEVYRFGGAELHLRANPRPMLLTFFAEVLSLAIR